MLKGCKYRASTDGQKQTSEYKNNQFFFSEGAWQHKNSIDTLFFLISTVEDFMLLKMVNIIIENI